MLLGDKQHRSNKGKLIEKLPFYLANRDNLQAESELIVEGVVVNIVRFQLL